MDHIELVSPRHNIRFRTMGILATATLNRFSDGNMNNKTLITMATVASVMVLSG